MDPIRQRERRRSVEDMLLLMDSEREGVLVLSQLSDVAEEEEAVCHIVRRQQ